MVKIFGEELILSTLSPWRFASKRVDEETGFVYFGRRYYQPSQGRWITPDPQGFADGPNLYVYVQNDPMTLIDLYGLLSKQIDSGRHFMWGFGEGFSYHFVNAGSTWMMKDLSRGPGGMSFFNSKTKRTFHLHHQEGHMEGKPHIDIRRRGPYEERKFLLKDE